MFGFLAVLTLLGVRQTISRHERFRRKAGYRVTEWARAVGFSHGYVSQVESGQVQPSRRYRKACADFLGVTEEELWGNR